MRPNRVLLISHTPLFAEAVTHLLQHQAFEVVAPTGSNQEFGFEPIEDSVSCVIVEMDSLATLNGTTAGPSEQIAQWCINEHVQSMVFLTRENNRMVVHRCETVEDVTSEQLIQALSR